jgi:hypothetical protein
MPIQEDTYEARQTRALLQMLGGNQALLQHVLRFTEARGGAPSGFRDRFAWLGHILQNPDSQGYQELNTYMQDQTGGKSSLTGEGGEGLEAWRQWEARPNGPNPGDPNDTGNDTSANRGLPGEGGIPRFWDFVLDTIQQNGGIPDWALNRGDPPGSNAMTLDEYAEWVVRNPPSEENPDRQMFRMIEDAWQKAHGANSDFSFAYTHFLNNVISPPEEGDDPLPNPNDPPQGVNRDYQAGANRAGVPEWFGAGQPDWRRTQMWNGMSQQRKDQAIGIRALQEESGDMSAIGYNNAANSYLGGQRAGQGNQNIGGTDPNVEPDTKPDRDEGPDILGGPTLSDVDPNIGRGQSEYRKGLGVEGDPNAGQDEPVGVIKSEDDRTKYTDYQGGVNDDRYPPNTLPPQTAAPGNQGRDYTMPPVHQPPAVVSDPFTKPPANDSGRIPTQPPVRDDGRDYTMPPRFPDSTLTGGTTPPGGVSPPNSLGGGQTLPPQQVSNSDQLKKKKKNPFEPGFG